MRNMIKDILPATEQRDFTKTYDPAEAVAQVRRDASMRNRHGNRRSDA